MSARCVREPQSTYQSRKIYLFLFLQWLTTRTHAWKSSTIRISKRVKSVPYKVFELFLGPLEESLFSMEKIGWWWYGESFLFCCNVNWVDNKLEILYFDFQNINIYCLFLQHGNIYLQNKMEIKLYWTFLY